MAEIVEGKALLETVVYSFVSAIVVTAIFSTALYGATRSAEFRRDERPVAAGAMAIVATLSIAACLVAVVLGIIVMTSK